jgi:hypothetical protein
MEPGRGSAVGTSEETAVKQAAVYPDGIGEKHFERRGIPGSRWFMLVALGAILGAAMLGAFGGGSSPSVSVKGERAALTVEAPRTLRNGEFFEIRLRADAVAPLARPTIAVSAEYWRGLTINTMIPAPASEAFEDEYYIFEFEPLDGGERLELKIDGQVNPSLFGGTQGAVELRDGEGLLAAIPMRLRVLP